jgi:hypothetical protein
VPAEEGIGLNVHQGITPRKHAPQNDHNQPRGIVARCGFTLRSWNKASCLRKKRFSAASARRDRETSEIVGNEGQRGEAVCQQLEDGAGHKRSALHVTRRYTTANCGRAKVVRSTGQWTKL